MNFYTIAPPAHLSEYIRFFWVLEGKASKPNPYVHRTMANGCVELFFHYQGGFGELDNGDLIFPSKRSGIQGQTQFFRRFKVEVDFGIFGAYLFPHILPLVFSVSSLEMSNQEPSFDEVLGNVGANLEEQIMLAPNNDTRAFILGNFIERRLTQAKSVKPGIMESIQMIVKQGGRQNVNQLASQNFLSVRQFERNFKTYAGFSPKLYSRIVRFQSTLAYYKQNIPLAAIALENGYYDQSHFIHEFRQFSGHNPKAYFSGTTESTRWKDS